VGVGGALAALHMDDPDESQLPVRYVDIRAASAE
jgi:hypothetical protein